MLCCINGILLSTKNKWAIKPQQDIQKPNEHLVKQKGSAQKCYILCSVLKKTKLERKLWLVVAKDWGSPGGGMKKWTQGIF